MAKSVCSLNDFSSSSCEERSLKISAIGQACVSMPLWNGRSMFLMASVDMQVYDTPELAKPLLIDGVK